MKKTRLLFYFLLFTFYFSSAQNVGIGTSTPAYKLDVKNGSINTDSVYRIKGFPVLFVNGSMNSSTYIGVHTALAGSSGYANTGCGYASLYSNTTGIANTACGSESLFSNTTGSFNTAVGSFSLTDNTTGYMNSAFGIATLGSNTTGQSNTAIGHNVLTSNTTGNYNTSGGAGSLLRSTTGSNNTAFGYNTLAEATAASYNTAIGSDVLQYNTGVFNTASGASALHFNTGGSANSAYGMNALTNNSTGGYNTAMGFQALFSNTTGQYNVAVGPEAFFYNVFGNQNTAFGYRALLSTTGSNGNTAIGYQAGNSFNNGYYNTFLGSDADANANDLYNSVAIGNTSTITAPLQIRIGNSLMSSIGGYQNWSNVSDGRYKKDVKEDVKGIDFIMKLRPVTYHLDVSGISKKLNESRGKEMNQLMKASVTEKEQILFSGFVAQEVERAAKETGYDFSGVDKPKNENDLYGLRYAEFVVPLVKALQEQQVIIDSLQKQLGAFKAEIPTNTAKQQQMIMQQQSQINDLVKKVEALEKKQENP